MNETMSSGSSNPKRPSSGVWFLIAVLVPVLLVFAFRATFPKQGEDGAASVVEESENSVAGTAAKRPSRPSAKRDTGRPAVAPDRTAPDSTRSSRPRRPGVEPRDRKSPEEPSSNDDEDAFVAPSRKKLGPADYDHPRDRTPIAWIRETPGYVPVEIAEQYQAHPYRWVLYGDGTVEYRTSSSAFGFQHYRVKLTAGELEDLVRKLVDTGFVEHKKLPSSGFIIADAGSEEIGLVLKTRTNRLEVDAFPMRMQQSPNDPVLLAIAAFRKIGLEFKHSKAYEYVP